MYKFQNAWMAWVALLAMPAAMIAQGGSPTPDIHPDRTVTFRLEAPLTVDGTEAAFIPAAQENYQQRTLRRPPGPGYGAPYGYAAPPPPYYYPYGPYYYGAYLSPYYGWGFGPNFYFSYRGGFRRR